MRLLHGSNTRVTVPNLDRCRSRNDFGRGFYLTPSWSRAWEMGRRRRNILQEGEITVNAFSFTMKAAQESGLRIATFKGFSPQWARFVISNRDTPSFTHDFDIVVGPVADAILDQEIFRYKREFGAAYMDEDALRVFISRVSQFGSSYVQYCFCTQMAIRQLKPI